MASPQVKLTYFGIEGLAEKVRLALTFCSVPFEDVRIEFKDWAAVKEKMPFGQMPLLEVTEADGSKKVFAQSGSMLRWVARKFDKTGTLYPADADALQEIEEVIGLSEDLAKEWSPCMYLNMGRHTKFGHPEEWPQKDDTVKRLRELFAAETLPRFMGFFTGRLNKTGAFLAGSKPTIVDFQVLAQLRYWANGVADHVPKDCLEKFPAILEWMNRMYTIPQIKAWYKM